MTVNAYASKSGTELVIGEGENRDEMQITGAWLKSDTPIDLGFVR